MHAGSGSCASFTCTRQGTSVVEAEKKSIQSSKYSGTGSRESGNRSRPHTAKATGQDAVAKKKREMREQV